MDVVADLADLDSDALKVKAAYCAKKFVQIPQVKTLHVAYGQKTQEYERVLIFYFQCDYEDEYVANVANYEQEHAVDAKKFFDHFMKFVLREFQLLNISCENGPQSE